MLVNFVKCNDCSTDKVEVLHGPNLQTAYRVRGDDGSWGQPIVGEPPAHLFPDTLSAVPTDVLGLLAMVLLAGGGRRPDAASMARAMAERAGDTAPPVKVDADGKPRGPRPGDPWNAARFDPATGPRPMPEAAKPADDPKVPAKPLKSLGLHICEDGGVVVTEWPEGAHPLNAVYATRSAGHAVNYALEALQKARQEQRSALRIKQEEAERAAAPIRIVSVDLGSDTGMAGFGLRP